VRPSRIVGAGVALGTIVAVLTLLEIRSQNEEVRSQNRVDRAFRAQGRIAELADRMMDKLACSKPTFCNVDGTMHCGFKNELAVRRSAANEYLWLMRNFGTELGIEQIQLAHASLVWFEALPTTPFEGTSFFGTDFRCAWFKTKKGTPISFRGTDFRSANLECALFGDEADASAIEWKAAVCPDGTRVSIEDSPPAGTPTTCEGHLKRPSACRAKCDDPAFTRSPPFSCPLTATPGDAPAGVPQDRVG
jgi:hypothetical protein